MLILALIGLGLFLLLVIGPRFWINWTLRAHGAERSDMPGTGGELARHLLDEAGLQHVAVEVTREGFDHYSPRDKAVRLSPAHHDGKSITAVAVAAHEVGHAIQDRDDFGPMRLREKLAGKTILVERIGSMILMATPLVFALVRSPAVIAVEVAAALAMFSATIVIHVVTLPTEFDASFKKALPVLESYLPPEEMPGARAVLRAAAFTYVAAALVNLINVGRWLRILRF